MDRPARVHRRTEPDDRTVFVRHPGAPVGQEVPEIRPDDVREDDRAVVAVSGEDLPDRRQVVLGRLPDRPARSPHAA